MKIKTILVILLLMSFSLILASEDSADAEHWEKVRQLDQLAERFKAETGFTGNVNYYYEGMKLQSYEGKFADIPFYADADTTSFRQACDRVLDKILPYSCASRNQLSMSRISKSSGYISTDYYQQVNGYRVEGSGFIVITYDVGRSRFDIGDNSVELPEVDIKSMITNSDAESIALSDKNDSRYKKAKVKSIFYTNLGSDKYYLAYFICVSDDSNPIFGDYSYYIDVSNGKVTFKHRDTFLYSNVSVRVVGNDYIESSVWNCPPTYHTEEPLNNVRVIVFPDSSQTDQEGFSYFNDVVDDHKVVKLSNSLFKVTCISDTLNAVSCTTARVDSLHNYTISIPDSSYYAPNAFLEAVNHVKGLVRLNGDNNYFQNHINIISFQTPPDSTVQLYGGYSPKYEFIWLRDGRLSDVVRHELSHHFVHSKIEVRSFDYPDTIHTNTGAMDEAFANYLCGAPSDNRILPGIGNYCDMSLLNEIHTSTSLNEEQYAKYINNISLASAWWSLRNNTNFPPDDQINGFDTLLVGGLDKVKLDINQNASYRHKPRYFYNILMSNVDTDESSWPLNNKQLAINKAYNDRGFHFYPTVESIAGSSTPIAQSFYNPGDSVYVHIKDCPQNTKVGIRVVPDVDTYTQIGAGGIAIPSAVSIGGNSVFREVKTNENGEWKGSIYLSNQLSPGEYDIIVDVGSPTTPDNRLNLVFAKDNIIDAVDGLNGAGFTVTNLGDAVVALDLSSSMEGYGMQQTARIPTIHRK